MNWNMPDKIYRAGWIRLWALGPGIAWTKEPPLFSEGNGYRKPFITVLGWRFFLVKSWKNS